MKSLTKPVLLHRVFTYLLVILCASCVPAPTRPTSSDDFELFISRANYHSVLRDFERELRVHRVYNVVPTYQLLQQGTDWRNNGLPQFAFPPARHWPNMIATLKFMQRFIIPVIGQIDVVSGFRTPTYNRVAGGAPRSQHLFFSALDIKPQSTVSRARLHQQLKQIWQVHGKGMNIGLGLYSGNRFHIDTGGYRQW